MAMSKSNYVTGQDLSSVIRDLEARLVALETAIGWDEHLRMQNPALQDLYEKYQTTKRLIS